MIGIFDSGFGGLTVLSPILKELPQYDYLYLGDNARAPYGNHSQESVREFSKQAVEYLFSRGAVLVIIACNTACAAALRSLQQEYLNGSQETDRKILGVLLPTAEAAAQKTKNKQIGVIGTKLTIASEVYNTELTKLQPAITTTGKACPLLVPFIEEDWHHKPEATSVAKKYLKPLKDHHIDTLILGCTHYPLMTKEIKNIMGRKVQLIDCGKTTAFSLKDYLSRHPEIESKLTRQGTKTFCTTDDPQYFQQFAEKYLGQKISKPQKISLSTTPTQ